MKLPEKKRCKSIDINFTKTGMNEVNCENKATRKWHGVSVCQKHFEKLQLIEKEVLRGAVDVPFREGVSMKVVSHAP